MNRLPLAVLLPTLASFVACGGSVAPDGPEGGSSGSAANPSSSGGGTSSGGTSSGGSSGVTPPAAGLDIDLCAPATEGFRPLRGVVPGAIAKGPDSGPEYLELREYSDGATGAPHTVIDREGTACAFGPEVASCKATLASTRGAGWPLDFSSGPGERQPTSRYVVTTSGDRVLTVSTLEELRKLVAPVEGAPDAALLAIADGKYRVTCDGKPNARVEGGRVLLRVQSGFACGAGTKVEESLLSVTREGAISVESTVVIQEGQDNCAIGRKPEGLAPRRGDGTCEDVVGRFFASAAHLEAASVVSFERLARELDALGAPRTLVDAARAAAADEVRHTHATSAIARRFGAETEAPEVTEPGARSALAIALENATEGCVRETYGALCAHWQASHAGDLRIRAAMRVIAEDETRHAELSWAVASFLDGLLSREERDVVARAQGGAIASLARELDLEPHASLVAFAGMPRAREARGLLAALDVAHLRAAA